MIVGARRGPFEACSGVDFLRRYAVATADPSPAVGAGVAVPPVALTTLVWDAQHDARSALVADDVQLATARGVHGEHDVVVHRPVVPGEPLRIWVDVHGARPAGRNSLVVLRFAALDDADRVVAEQWWTTVYLGTALDAAGAPAPDHAFPEAARPRLVGTHTVEIDPDMARRYAEVSGDWSDHHFDVEAARRSGSDRVFLHGLCTMALCAPGVIALVAGGSPERLRRVAVRFASPAPLGEQLHVRVYDAGPLGYAFEADCGGTTVITHGRAEVHGERR